MYSVCLLVPTKYHRLGIYFLAVLEIRVQDEGASRVGFFWEALSSLRMACLLPVSSRGLPSVSYFQIPFSFKVTNHIGLEYTLMFSFNFTSLKTQSLKTETFWDSEGQNFNIWIVREYNSAHNIYIFLYLFFWKDNSNLISLRYNGEDLR